MGRASFQVLVIPFRLVGPEKWEFAAFRRSDDGAWQGIAGGGEAGETPRQAAARESVEEAGLPPQAPLYRLDASATVPVAGFADRVLWPVDLLVIPEHAFAIDCTGLDLRISSEHTALMWGAYHDIHAMLRWDSNRTALWELHELLRSDRLGPGRRT
jgi:dATP pyrophosphohydrolase